jgi:hypothetical protein
MELNNIAKGYATTTTDSETGVISEKHYALLPDGTVLESANMISGSTDRTHFFGRSKKAVVSKMTWRWLTNNAIYIGNYRFSGNTIL